MEAERGVSKRRQALDIRKSKKNFRFMQFYIMSKPAFKCVIFPPSTYLHLILSAGTHVDILFILLT